MPAQGASVPMAKRATRRRPKAGPSRLGFNVVVERDEDGWFVGRVVELPGCHTQGKTLAEVDERIREAIALYLEVEGPPSASKFVAIHHIEVSA
jgi:predicted RNase H-like HicB family nuclease